MMTDEEILKKAKKHLAKVDPVMARLREKIELSVYSGEREIFPDIVEIILGQQLSEKAADTIISRFKSKFKSKTFPSPQEIWDMSDERIRECGTSWAKIKYIKNVSRAFLDGTLEAKRIRVMADDKVRESLLAIKGIGPWTVEMVLLFTLRRRDIFSPGDVGLQRAMERLYKVKRGDTRKMMEISSRWSPYRSVACRYLWRSLELSEK